MTEKEIYQAIYGKRKSEKVVPSKGKKGRPMPRKFTDRKSGDVRRECFERDGGWCMLKVSKKCWRSATWDTGHMHHIKHKSLGGKNELDNVVWGCPPCHRAVHVPEKVVPSKREQR